MKACWEKAAALPCSQGFPDFVPFFPAPPAGAGLCCLTHAAQPKISTLEKARESWKVTTKALQEPGPLQQHKSRPFCTAGITGKAEHGGAALARTLLAAKLAVPKSWEILGAQTCQEIQGMAWTDGQMSTDSFLCGAREWQLRAEINPPARGKTPFQWLPALPAAGPSWESCLGNSTLDKIADFQSV